MPTELKMFIDGRSVSALDGATIESLNPSTGVPWATIPSARADDVDCAVAAAQRAFENGAWSLATRSARGQVLQTLAAILSQPETEGMIANLETQEWGRVCRDARKVVRSFVEYLRFFISAAAVTEDSARSLETPGLFNFESRVPWGVIGVILPWNSPLTLAGYKIIPALLMGNSVVVKPSELCSAPMLALAALFTQAGLPAGVLNVVTGAGPTGEALASHPGINKIAFTGGPLAGAAVYECAARRLAGATLELGGKSANVVFADANLERATDATLDVFRSAGQACIAPSRLLVQASVYDQVVQTMVQKARNLSVGDPWDTDMQVGPVRSARQFRKISGYIDRAKHEGALLLTGGGRPSLSKALEGGWFIEPTVFADVRPGSELDQAEVFGPVLAILKFDTEDQAVAIANGTRYGLAAGAWTRDFARAHRLGARLQAGTVWINTRYHLSPRVPFGGMKQSGIGRDGGLQALAEFSQSKNVVMDFTTD